MKAFAPMMRLTQRAFAAVDDAYRRGWHGHYEALWPTVIAAAGMRIVASCEAGGNAALGG